MMLRLEPLVHREEIHIGKNITAPYKNLQTALEREKQQKVFKKLQGSILHCSWKVFA